MPVGEVGKHLHLITGSHAISRRLKENYQGLKKAIEAAKCVMILCPIACSI